MNGNLQINECHNVAYDTVSNIILCANQDVGRAQQSATGSVIWDTINQGDGGDVAVDTLSGSTQSTRYSSAQNLANFRREVYNSSNVRQSVDFPALTVTGGGAAFQALFTTPVEVNAVNGSRVLISGSNAFYESLDKGETLIQFTGPENDFQVNAMAYGGKSGGVNNAEVIYVAGTTGAKIFTRTIAGTAVTETAAAYPGRAGFSCSRP